MKIADIKPQDVIEFHSKEAAGHNRAWKRELHHPTVMGQDRARWHKKQEAKHQAELAKLFTSLRT